MPNYYKVMLGRSSIYSQECFDGNFIGTDFDIYEDLSQKLSDRLQDFNQNYRDIWMAQNPGRGKVSAGLSCAFLWRVSKEIQESDYILCPDGDGSYRVCQVIGPYYYADNEILPHRRPVTWLNGSIPRVNMSTLLLNSIGAIGTVTNVTPHGKEIDDLIHNHLITSYAQSPPDVEDITVFGLEKHLEDFLVHNWSSTPLGQEYDIYTDDGAVVGQQFPTDTGPIDILGISKDKKTLLVVELKKGRASDSVVGQVQRYMGYVHEELKEEEQEVKGLIIALEDDIRIRRALTMTNNIDFYRYKVNFELIPA